MTFETVTLKSITSLITKGTTPTSIGCSFSESGINYIKSECIGNGRTLDSSKYCFISLTTHEKLKRSKIYENDILFSMAGMFLGKTGIVQKYDIPANTNQAVAIIRIVDSLADIKYVYYYMNQNDFVYMVNSLSGQSAQPNINLKQIGELEIRLPSLENQHRIASILSALDDKIELNNQINENLEQQAQISYDKMFSNCIDFCDLGTVIQTTSGGTPSRKIEKYYENGNQYWVKSKELQSTFISKTEEMITDDAIKNSSAKILPSNSVLIAMYGATVGEFGIISKEMACNQAICALIPNEQYPFTYLFMFAKNNKHNMLNLAVGSAQQNISQVLIKGLSVCSNIETIAMYHKLVLPLFNEMQILYEENQRLAELRDTLLPKLMSGEIDVSEARI